jgi:hypothetical protein
MPVKYTPPTDQSIVFLNTDPIRADTYNQNIKAPDVKLEHFVSFIDKNNANGLNTTYGNAQGLSYQNIAPSSLGTNKIEYGIGYINTTASAVATVVGTTYLSPAIPIEVDVGVLAGLNLNLRLSNKVGYTINGSDPYRPIFTCGYTVRVLESNTATGTYTEIYTKTETSKKINGKIELLNILAITSQSVSSSKYLKLELTVTGNPLATPNNDQIANANLPGATWNLTLSLDPSSTYQCQKSFA